MSAGQQREFSVRGERSTHPEVAMIQCCNYLGAALARQHDVIASASPIAE
jgi:hypothetical protein